MISLAAEAFRELARYPDLLGVLIRKELKVRYKTTSLGFVWAVLVPLVHMAVLWGVFQYAFKVAVPLYPYFLLSGLVPWMFCAQTLPLTTFSLVEQAPLLKRIRFPHAAIPLSIAGSEAIHAVIALVLVAAGGLALGQWTAALPLVLVWLALEGVFLGGLSLGLATLEMEFRDTRYLLNAVFMIWFYATPIIYPPDLAPQVLQDWWVLNPMACYVELFRSSLMAGRAFPWTAAAGGAAWAALALAWGGRLFLRREPDLVSLV